MAHAEPRSTPLREGAIGVLTGATYGVVHTLSGHPLDNLKAQLQLTSKFHGVGSIATARSMWRQDGLAGFFRGAFHPMWGSAIYRAIMISGYEACYTFFEQRYPDDSFWKREYAGGCVRPMVVASATLTSLCRSLVEAPIEQAKVMRQTNRPWEWGLLYRGLPVQTARTTALLVLIFVPYDVARRKAPGVFGSLSGQVGIVTAVCAFAYAAAWSCAEPFHGGCVPCQLTARCSTWQAARDAEELRAGGRAAARRDAGGAAALPGWPARPLPRRGPRRALRRAAQWLRHACHERSRQPAGDATRPARLRGRRPGFVTRETCESTCAPRASRTRAPRRLPGHLQ